ncbi:MAG: hypothetical protein IPG60_08455 [Bacteroidetes bacterium]|nr:hypothetical protein [Bacteroidota bacterium]MBK7110771.1 hypothetical protein [Bacteroidota bacterium]MBK8488009.1 hypothetical protein [Bacteroidota bacterium]
MKYLSIILLVLMSCNLSDSIQNCKGVSTSFIPLADLKNDTFNNYNGGKYPNGQNAIPLAHYKKGIQLFNAIFPIDINGHIDSINGKIGFMILGFSTAAMTGNVFKLICTMKDLDPHLTIGIGAQGGMDINAMLDEGSGYWRKAILDLSNVGLSNAQIQLIWISTGDMQSASLEFPKQSIALADKYHTLLLMIKQKYPNIKIVFLSDRTFAGYIDNNGPQLLAEPTAYYTSWAVKFLIERQLQSLTDYTYSDIPFIDWGPMLWTNGETGDSYNYKWDCDDAAKGGIHPTAKGRSKEAIRLYNFFSNHPYTKQWFTSPQSQAN